MVIAGGVIPAQDYDFLYQSRSGCQSSDPVAKISEAGKQYT
jgi:methylmalonyl-CoA mutase cobalamin-binding subunit